MIADEFDQRTLANMEVALERVCERFPELLAGHEARKLVAFKIIECARSGERSLGEFTRVARAAVAADGTKRSPTEAA
ncbi:MAG: hypothetical protein ACJ8FZ_03500 [Bradyrhizobium sp.]